jgi:MFS family permease
LREPRDGGLDERDEHDEGSARSQRLEIGEVGEVGEVGERPARPSLLAIARSAARFARQRPEFVRWVTLSGVVSGFVATFSFYGQALLLHSGWALVGIGVLAASREAIGSLMSVLSHRAVARFGERRTVVVGSVVASLGLCWFGWVPGAACAVGYIVDSAASDLIDPIVNQGLNRLVPTEQRATLLSANSTAFSLFMVLGFPLLGLLIGRVGLVHAAETSSLIGATVILLAATWWWRPL